MTNYSPTLNLPKTSFPMKANLAERELEILKLWQEQQLYLSLREKGAGQNKFVLHDGPPYANGHVHIGTTLNKVLKDITVKAKNMEGFDAPFVPGWDCHGLPIELQVMKNLTENATQVEIRKACRVHAQKFVDLQKQEFQRLGVVGDWENPYLTMSARFEAGIAAKMFALVRSGSLNKGEKPVHWCTECCTALAQAELEYKNHKSCSVYVRFTVENSKAFCQKNNLPQKSLCLVVWTTTPWTLPANTAVCLHSDYKYSVLETSSELLVVASELLKPFQRVCDVEGKVVAQFEGRDLLKAKCKHPFLERVVPVVLGEHVNLMQGTGCIHTAPGHGEDDFLVGQKYGLPVLCFVDHRGCFTNDDFYGKKVWSVNSYVVDILQDKGKLLKKNYVEHEYPYCWRCRNPVIVRTTPQWFISMDENDLRENCIEETEKTRWIPQWGKKRMRNMLQKRPDWCVSRQRSWGVPLAIFHCNRCQKQVKDEKVMQHIVDLFKEHTSDVWFTLPFNDLLPKDYTCCGVQDFSKEEDVLDVWFDSGVTQDIVLQRSDLKYPADLYLEGNDQFRGWFQSSLALAVATNKLAPYSTVATHGYVVESCKKEKVSKSRGALFPKDLIAKYGADLLRLWVASENFRDDVEFSLPKLEQVQGSYRKLRNTYRYLLGNLYDDNGESHSYKELPELEKYILARLYSVNTEIRKGYEKYEYHVVFQLILNFFSNELSSLYFCVRKDALYSDEADCLLRRQTQFVLRKLLFTTLPWIAPVLSFTAEEIWQHVRKNSQEKSVHLTHFCDVEDEYNDHRVCEKWSMLLTTRDLLLKRLEKSKNNKTINTFAQAHVLVEGNLTNNDCLILKELLQVACVSCDSLKKDFQNDEFGEVTIEKFKGDKCERCWNFTRINETGLCERCERVLN
ncbi:isoleucine--tRNA ligase [Candidatus Uabimicrobium sp. HlEnr_7]|uniref:isoleucine--tRNA ligase n=1 Tax=Candidatus Uabimicrobium helgolandensis TaxID=3095367 RepID=UPI00355892C4